MKADPLKRATLLRTPSRLRGTEIPGLMQAWIGGVSASTIAVRTHDLALFGRFAFASRTVSDAFAQVIAALQHGSGALDSLAIAWDDEQRENGLAWETRARRRRTLRSIVALALARRVVPPGVRLDSLARDQPPRGDAASLAAAAIDVANATHRWRDAAIVALAWDLGASCAAMQRLRIDDLPISCSQRGALALSRVAGSRPPDAYVFAGRNASKPIDAKTIEHVIRAAGLPGMTALRRARRARLRELGLTETDARAPFALADET